MSIALTAGTTQGPRLRPDVTIVEQVFRGETSFVVKDPVTHKYFRFRPVEAGVMRYFDGRRTPEEIAAALAEQGVKLTTRAVEAFARNLANIGLLERTLADRTTLQIERLRAERRRRRRPALFRGELLRMRWSFGDPDALFDRTLPALRWMFTPAFVVTSVILFATYFIILAATWGEFSRTLATQYTLSTITFGTVVIVWLTGLVVVLIHELGHGYACKYFGGEVHELGVMLVYFQPAFYCNVNDAWSFPALRSRLWVTAAGGWIQFVIAGIGAIVWLTAQPGTLASQIAVATIIVGGATTLVTNANPLLPLDGYFALIDWLEIPNLRTRAQAYFGWWVRRHVLRLDFPEPAASDRERRVFLVYGALSLVYIVGLLGFLAFWVTGQAHRALGVIGATIVLALVAAMVRKPAVTWGRSIAMAVRAWNSRRRGRPWWRWPAMMTLGTLALLAVLPWTLTTTGRFVVAPVRTAGVVAPDSGIVAAVLVGEGTRVTAGTPLVRIIDRGLERQLLTAIRAADSLGVAVARARARGDGGLTERLEAQRAQAVATVSASQLRVDALTIRAPLSGVVVTPRVYELAGHRVDAGDHLMDVAVIDSLEVRVAMGRGGAANIRTGQVVHLMAYDHSAPADGLVGTVAPAGSTSDGAIEVRVPIARTAAWRAGTTGEASVELQRSTVLGALWWNVRQRIRGDLLL